MSEGEGILSDDLLAELGENALVQPGGTDKKKRKKEVPAVVEDPKLSKNQRRKIESILKSRVMYGRSSLL
jgi:hypothetical protein